MAKRPAEGHVFPDRKRQKLQGDVASDVQSVSSSRQLKHLLTFQQDASVELQKGECIRSFKVFLETILYTPDRSSTTTEQSILKEFLESQSPKSTTEDEAPMLQDLMQAWSFFAQANNDRLMSAVSAVLALLLKTISTLIDFRDLGIQLCQSLLQTSQLKLISRALAYTRQKEHVISPALRLLTEVVMFDGGILARRVFAARLFTFDGKIMARNLSLWKAGAEDGGEGKRRPAVRSNAVRYLLAHLKHQSSVAKSEILKYGNVMRSLFEHLQHDPTNVLKEVLDAIKQYVLNDDSILRSTKGYVMNDRNLSNLASFYRFEPSQEDSSRPRRTLVKDLLVYVCTDPRAGLLRPFAGWYPPGTDRDVGDLTRDDDAAEIDLGLDSIQWYNRYTRQVPVRNSTLANFAQHLRPFANPEESELLLKICEAAPELVADYFYKKIDFAFDPKLTATWVGYASFVFSSVALDVPEFFGRGESYGTVPPPVSIVLENVLPQPLSQKVLTRCLNQQNELVSFLVVQILVISFQKMAKILSCFDDAAQTEGPLWVEGASRLIDSFAQRCPKLKDVVSTYKKTSPDSQLQREAVLHLIELYYKVTPEMAAEAKFDISTTLAEELNYFELRPTAYVDAVDERLEQLRLLNLRHMLLIASKSPDMRWTHKPDVLKYSPLLTLLRLLVNLSLASAPTQMWDLASSVLQDHGLVQQQTAIPALHALVASLKSTSNWAPSESIFTFLDDVLARTIREPLKYLDRMMELDEVIDPQNASLSLIFMTLVEQWPFAAGRPEQAKAVAGWLGRYLVASKIVGENDATLVRLSDVLSRAAKDDNQRSSLRLSNDESIQDFLATIKASHTPKERKSSDSTDSDATLPLPPTIDPNAFVATPSDSKASALHRWSTKDIPSAISDGDLSSLILCLSSDYPEVRIQALTNLRAVMSRLDNLRSTYSEAPQFYLLIGTLINTATPLLQRNSSSTASAVMASSEGSPLLPNFLTVYTALATRILQEPLHPLYDALNRFHTRSPNWDPERLASYWIHTILYTPCTASAGLSLSSDKHPRPSNVTTTSYSTLGAEAGITTFEALLNIEPISTPTQFLLAFVYHSLRTPADLAILRKRGSLEPLLAMAGTRRDVLTSVLEILWRITTIEGGGDVLVRKGVCGWIGTLLTRSSSVVAEQRMHSELVAARPIGKVRRPEQEVLSSARGLKMLVRRIWETCDREWAEPWSGGVLEKMVTDLTQGL